MPKRSDAVAWEVLADLSEKALANAVRLSDEAKLLGEHGHRERSFVLAILAFEEFGKSLLCFDAALGDYDEAGWRRFWRRVEDHQEKFRMAFAFGCLYWPDTEEEWAAMQEDFEALVEALPRLKMEALYVDALPGQGGARTPWDVVAGDHQALVRNARRLICTWQGMVGDGFLRDMFRGLADPKVASSRLLIQREGQEPRVFDERTMVGEFRASDRAAHGPWRS